MWRLAHQAHLRPKPKRHCWVLLSFFCLLLARGKQHSIFCYRWMLAPVIGGCDRTLIPSNFWDYISGLLEAILGTLPETRQEEICSCSML